MYKTRRTVDGMPLRTAVTEIDRANILEAEAGCSYTPDGGDHGGRGYIRLTDGGSTQWEINRLDSGVEIRFIGSSECVTMIEMLKFILRELEAGKHES